MISDTKMPQTINSNSRREKRKTFLVLFIGSAFGLGLSPIIPGTCGAVLGVLFHIVVVKLFPAVYHLPLLVTIFFIVCALNHWLFPWARRYWNSSDPKHFVLDEVAGYLLVPILFRHGSFWAVLVWGFVLFRLYDIIKMPIARQIDRKMHNAWGVVLDDIVAAIYAVITMYLLSWLGPFTVGGIIIPVP